jgi:adenylate cyclase
MARPNRAEEPVAFPSNARVRRSSIAANVIGAIVVFAFLTFFIPVPKDVQHQTTALILNGALLGASLLIGIPIGTVILERLWRERTAWVASGRDPTPREQELTLRFPIVQHQVIAALWLIDAVFFAGVNAFFSLQLAAHVGLTVAMGGLTTVALGYLMSERLMRPLTAVALASGVPARPQLPGVAARALLAFTLGAGVVLLGLVFVGAGTLLNGEFTVSQLARIVVVLAVAGLVIGLTAMIELAKSLAGPITALRAAVGRVEQGDLSRDVEVDDGSEVGLLQAGFNRMLAGLREREEIRDLFGRQVGEDVMRHALEHGVELGGEARSAAVLFVDLEGSTRLAAQRDPAAVVSLLNDFFAIVVDVLAHHGGWVNKFEGDAALCVFGAPLADEACAGKALAAGRELACKLAESMPEIKAGIGISAGRVVAGNVGAAQRFEYTVIGDPVNEAARLSELAKGEEGRIVASGAALAAAGEEESAHWVSAGQVTLRGRARPTQLAVPADASAAGEEPVAEAEPGAAA